MFPANPIAGRRFRPRLVPTLITLVLLPLLLWLAWWQLDRAEQKQALQDRYQRQLSAPPVPLSELSPAAPENRYRRVEVSGEYDTDHQLLLDNQIVDGEVGFHVYTPLLWGEPRQAILVNRGWIALGESRARLPDPSLEQESTTLRGRLAQPANPGIRLGESLAEPGWPKVVPYVDYPALAEMLDQPLVPAVILLDPEAPDGYHRDWQPRFGVDPQRHTGYAVQWLALAVTLLILFLVFGFRPHDSDRHDTNR